MAAQLRVARARSLPELLAPVLIAIGFAGGFLSYKILYPDHFDYLTSDEVALGFFTSFATYWFAVKVEESSTAAPGMRTVDEFLMGTGINFILQALLNYLDLLTRSAYLIVVGAVFTAALLWIVRHLLRSREPPRGTLIIGPDPEALRLARLMNGPVAGCVGGDCAGAPAWGFDELASALERQRPENILATAEGSRHVECGLLLAERMRGVWVTSVAEQLELVMGRVDCRGIRPSQLVLSGILEGNPRAVAVQAIYTNVLGLILLIAAVPVIAAVSLGIALFSGPGPVIESVECAGFQRIPFRRMRFRTRRWDDGRTRIGALVTFLKLENLPVLFNLVRGEMALFGPRAVRCELVPRLTELIPAYPLRFVVKPGMIHWGAIDGKGEPRSEITQFEYDLYYVKHGSPLLDLEILTRRILGLRRKPDYAGDLSPAG